MMLFFISKCITFHDSAKRDKRSAGLCKLIFKWLNGPVLMICLLKCNASLTMIVEGIIESKDYVAPRIRVVEVASSLYKTVEALDISAEGNIHKFLVWAP